MNVFDDLWSIGKGKGGEEQNGKKGRNKKYSGFTTRNTWANRG
jgi:hypothetical protein